jgi:hypothetical protein
VDDCERGVYRRSTLSSLFISDSSSITYSSSAKMLSFSNPVRIAIVLFVMSLFMSSTSSPLHAQSGRWVQIAAGEHTTIFADRLSIRREGARVRIWTKWAFSTEQDISSSANKKYRSQKNLDVYHCGNRTSATLQSISYSGADADGDVVDSTTYPDALARYAEVVPESVGESILLFVCRASKSTGR